MSLLSLYAFDPRAPFGNYIAPLDRRTGNRSPYNVASATAAIAVVVFVFVVKRVGLLRGSSGGGDEES